MISDSANDAPEREAASIEAELAAQDWDELSRRLTRYAHVRLRKASWETAEEIAQEAIARLLDPAYASWDRQRHPDLFDCLGHIVNGLVSNHHQRKAVRARHVPIREDATVHADEDDAPRDPRAGLADDDHEPPEDAVVLRREESSEREVARDRRAEAAIAALRLRLQGDALALALLDQIVEGEGKPVAQARALKVSVAEVYTIKQRLMHHARLVGRDFAEGES